MTQHYKQQTENAPTSTAGGSDRSIGLFSDDLTDMSCGNADWKNPINSTTVCWLATNKPYEEESQNGIGLCSVLRPLQHSIGYMGDGFYRSKDPTNSIKVLKEATKENNTKNKENTKFTCIDTQKSRQIQHTSITQQVPQSTIIWGD